LKGRYYDLLLQLNARKERESLLESTEEHDRTDTLKAEMSKKLETEKKTNRIQNELKVELKETKKVLNVKQKNGRCVWNRQITNPSNTLI
jgi:hypothetical protein